MAEKKLGDILDAYESRKAAEEAASHEKAEKQKIRTAEVRLIMTNKVVPALTNVARQIMVKGHKAELSNLLGESFPQLIFAFTGLRLISRTPELGALG